MNFKSRAKKVRKVIDPITEIMSHAKKPGVTIIIDPDESTSTSKSGSAYSYDSKSKILTINASSPLFSDEHNRQFLLEIIRSSFDAGGLIFKSEKSDLLKEYSSYYKKNLNEDILNVFRKIISHADYEALKMSFFVREESKKGRPIHSLRNDIKDKFGDRGLNIANLCTAGYFESELHEIYKRDTVNIEEFKRYYDLVVTQKARALFVHSNMTPNEVMSQVIKMVEKARKYHIDDFRIHGIGQSNIDTITKAIKLLEEESEDFQEGLFTIDLTSKEPYSIVYTVKIEKED
ncbi:MAG: hypothetical protein J0L87_10760 [Bacteroidetes bacterium]|nr:hypothetical protein [Bacteroidota bacterium]